MAVVHLSGIIDMDYLKKCDATNCKVLVCFFVYTWLMGNVGNVSWRKGVFMYANVPFNK